MTADNTTSTSDLSETEKKIAEVLERILGLVEAKDRLPVGEDKPTRDEIARADTESLGQTLKAYAALADAIGRALEAEGEDDAQLANVDLQHTLQNAQQTLQMLSNISKMVYDTAQSVIRKIGG